MANQKIESPLYKAWKRLKTNYPAMVSMVLIGVALFLALFAALIAPDKTPNANDQVLELANQNPGFTIDVLEVRRNRSVRKTNIVSKIFAGRDNPYELVPINNYSFEGDEIVVEVYRGEAYAAEKDTFSLLNVLYPYDEREVKVENVNASLVFTSPDGKQHSKVIQDLQKQIEKQNINQKKYRLGTDKFGRDILSRLLFGLRVSLSVGFVAVLISLFIGITIGATAGFYRNDNILVSYGGILGFTISFIALLVMAIKGVAIPALAYLGIFVVAVFITRLVFKQIAFFKQKRFLPYDDIAMLGINTVWSIPTILLAMALSFALGKWIKSFWVIYIAVGLSMWVEVARIVRGQVLTMREMEFVQAAKGLGFGNFRTIFLHILPNIVGPLMVIMAANFAAAILIEAGLSFIGIGVQPPKPSLGNMLSEYRNYLYVPGKAFLALAPGFCIMILVLSFNLVGNGLRDAFDVKGRLN